MFPHLLIANIEGCIFNEPSSSIIGILRKQITLKEQNGWRSFREVVEYFIGKYKIGNYKHLMEKMIKTYVKLGFQTSLKLPKFLQ